MFLIGQLARSAFVRVMAARAQAKALRLQGPAEKAQDKLQALEKTAKTPVETMNLFQAKLDADRLVAEWEVAQNRADYWDTKRWHAVNPTTRVPAYLAGKLDALALGAVAYPFVPEVIALVKAFL